MLNIPEVLILSVIVLDPTCVGVGAVIRSSVNDTLMVLLSIDLAQVKVCAATTNLREEGRIELLTAISLLSTTVVLMEGVSRELLTLVKVLMASHSIPRCHAVVLITI